MASSSRSARARYLSSIVRTSLIPEKWGNHSECSSYFCWSPYRFRLSASGIASAEERIQRFEDFDRAEIHQFGRFNAPAPCAAQDPVRFDAPFAQCCSDGPRLGTAGIGKQTLGGTVAQTEVGRVPRARSRRRMPHEDDVTTLAERRPSGGFIGMCWGNSR